MEKLLFSVEDITPNFDMEIVKESYFVIFGYDPTGKAEALSFNDGNEILKDLSGDHAKLKQWFFMGITPIFKTRWRDKHVFPGGLPLYHGPKTNLTSIYVAIMESDRGAKDAGNVLRDMMSKVDINPLMDAALNLAAVTQPQVALIKPAFSLTIKAIEEALIRNGDDIDYTNVFTFKESNSFLAGKHADWGNHKLKLTFSIDVR